MRITIDVRLLSRGSASGIEEYTRNLLRAMMTIDNNNDYTFFYNGLRKKPLECQVSGIKYQVIDWKIPNKLFDLSSRFLSWPKIDSLIKSDLVFSPHFNILKVKKTPRVITFHDLSFIHHPYFFSWKQKFWHWLQNIKKQARQTEKIIAVSEFTKNDLVNTLGIKPEKIEVIYSGISEEFKTVDELKGYGHRPTVEESKKQNSSTRPYILYLGTLEPRKNVEAVIRAFNLLKTKPDFGDFRLILAGRPGWLYDNILKEASRSPFKNDIVFLGAVSGKDRVRLYSGAKVFVYPSFFEGFGFPPLEAQACGCPTVVAQRAALPEILGQSALFVDPWRVEEVAAAIEFLVNDPKLRREIIETGFLNAKRFNWQNSAEKTLKLFNSIVRTHLNNSSLVRC